MHALRSGFVCATAFGLSLGLAGASLAVPVEAEFGAVVRGIYDTVDPNQPVWDQTAADLAALGVSIGAPVQGSLRYDTTAARLFAGNPDVYDASSLAVAFQIGLLNGGVSAGALYVFEFGGVEWLQFGGLLDLGTLQGEAASGSLLLVGDGLDAWRSGSLPSALPALDQLHPFSLPLLLDGDPLTQATTLAFSFQRCADFAGCQTVGVVSELTRLAAVPEPGAAWLVGLLAAGWSRRAKRVKRAR